MSAPLHHSIQWGPCNCCPVPVSDVCDHCLDMSGDHKVAAWPCETAQEAYQERTSVEYGIERLIPPWSTNPVFPAGEPYADRRVEGHWPSRSQAEVFAVGWERGTWRVMERRVSEWTEAGDPS